MKATKETITRKKVNYAHWHIVESTMCGNETIHFDGMVRMFQVTQTWTISKSKTLMLKKKKPLTEYQKMNLKIFGTTDISQIPKEELRIYRELRSKIKNLKAKRYLIRREYLTIQNGKKQGLPIDKYYQLTREKYPQKIKNEEDYDFHIDHIIAPDWMMRDYVMCYFTIEYSFLIARKLHYEIRLLTKTLQELIKKRESNSLLCKRLDHQQ